MKLKYDDQREKNDFDLLPLDMPGYINQFGTGVCSLEELLGIGAYYRGSGVPRKYDPNP